MKSLSTSKRIGLSWQRLLGRITLFIWGPLLASLMKHKWGYQIENLPEIRQQYQKIKEEHGSIMICANHLTYIDSAIMIWAFASLPHYFLHYKNFPYNLPAVEKFTRNFKQRFLAFLVKCIPINRQGDSKHIGGIMSKVNHLLHHGESIMIFPEGGRSRTGRVDREGATYGVGQMLEGKPGCKVLCVYLRGDKQETYTKYPPKNSKFYFDLKLITPSTEQSGRRGQRDLSVQIISTLEAQEAAYFAKVNPLKKAS